MNLASERQRRARHEPDALFSNRFDASLPVALGVGSIDERLHDEDEPICGFLDPTGMASARLWRLGVGWGVEAEAVRLQRERSAHGVLEIIPAREPLRDRHGRELPCAHHVAKVARCFA